MTSGRPACPVTLNSGCDNAGLVFAYSDRLNYWVKVYSNAQDKVLIYQVSDGTWTQKSSSNYTITNNTPFTMTAEARAGAADSYAASLAAGQVGLWCSDASDNSFDDFQVRDIAGPPAGCHGDVRVAMPMRASPEGLPARGGRHADAKTRRHGTRRP